MRAPSRSLRDTGLLLVVLCFSLLSTSAGAFAREPFFHIEPLTPQRVKADAREWLESRRQQPLIAQSLAARGGDQTARQELVNAFAQAKDPASLQRTTSALILAELPPDAVKTVLAKRLQQGDLPAANAATLAISYGEDAAILLPAFEPYLRRDISKDPFRFHDVYWALRVLATTREAAAQYEQDMLKLAQHANPSIRRNAVLALGSMREKVSPEAVLLIMKALQDGNFNVRQTAVVAAINAAEYLDAESQKQVLALEPWPPTRIEIAPQSAAQLRKGLLAVEVAVARAVFQDDPSVLAELFTRAPRTVAQTTSLELLAHYVAWLQNDASVLVQPINQLVTAEQLEVRDVGLYLRDHLQPGLSSPSNAQP